MTQMDVFQTLKDTLVDEFELDPDAITPEARLNEDLDIDSIDAVDMIIKMQELTGCKVSPEDFKQVRTVCDVEQVIKNLLDEKESTADLGLLTGLPGRGNCMGSRVVVTGIGGLTALGHDWPQIAEHLRAKRSGVRHMDEWADIESLNTRLAAPVMAYDLPAHYTRKRTRSMSPVSLMSTRTSEMALEDAGLLG